MLEKSINKLLKKVDILDNISTGIFIVNSSKEIQYVNEETLHILGYLNKSEVIGKKCYEIFCPSDKISCPILDCGKKIDKSERILVNKKGIEIPILKSVNRVKLDDQIYLIESFIDLREQKKLVSCDSLTGLPNRLSFMNRLRSRIEYAKNNENSPFFGVLFIDLDNFKTINDTLGHHVGDLVLNIASDRILSVIRSSSRQSKKSNVIGDFVSRIGGDEFTVLIDNINKTEDIVIINNICKRITQSLSEKISVNIDGIRETLYVTSSIGVAMYPFDGKDIINLVKNADTAMYYAKHLGKNNIQYYNSEISKAYSTKLKLEHDIKKAIKNNEFKLYYQPQTYIDNGEILGFEALLRWEHSEYGLIYPDKFIQIAEITSDIIPLTNLTIYNSCRDLVELQKLFDYPIKMSINISPKYFLQKGDDIPITVKYILKEFNINPSQLEFEITESLLLDNVEQVANTMNELKKIGIKFSIDDFGTGYSSLIRIKKLPINALKIDKSFIEEIGKSQDNDAIIKSIIDLSINLNLDIIAEGVEKKYQEDFLLKNGCNIIQGYITTRPKSIDNIVKFCKSYKKR